ncbi:hypothetical protein Tco_0948599 [Tanacetum coccineum]
MVPATAPLIGFSGEIIWPIGQISLSVKIGDAEHSTSTRMNFVVVRSPSPYNEIIGRPGAQPRHIRLESIRHDRGSTVYSGTPAERSRRMCPSQTEEKKTSTRKKQGNIRGIRKTCRSRHHEGSSLSQLAVKSGNGKEVRRQLEDVCGLQRPKQGMPRVSIKGQILVDFIVERPEDDSLAAPIEVEEELPKP